jgi:hypothetical protein
LAAVARSEPEEQPKNEERGDSIEPPSLGWEGLAKVEEPHEKEKGGNKGKARALDQPFHENLFNCEIGFGENGGGLGRREIAQGTSGGFGFGRFAAAARAAADLFFGKENAYGENLFVVGSDRLDHFVDWHGAIAGLEEFLELALGVSLIGKSFGLRNSLSINPADPGTGDVVAPIEKDSSENCFPSIGQDARRFVDFIASGVDSDSKAGREGQLVAEFS